MATDENKPEWAGACTKCSCKAYNPTTTYGTCENTRSDGNICGHKGSEHKAN